MFKRKPKQEEAPEATKIGRRKFLKYFGTASATATAGVTPLALIAEEPVPADGESHQDKEAKDRCPCCKSKDRRTVNEVSEHWDHHTQRYYPVFCTHEWHDELAVAWAEGFLECADRKPKTRVNG